MSGPNTILIEDDNRNMGKGQLSVVLAVVCVCRWVHTHTSNKDVDTAREGL